jgi:predicted ABC-type ATPase
MLERMRDLRDAGESFAFETTLAGKAYVPFLRDARQTGYLIHLACISPRNPALAKSRVADRVAEGGHDIPPADIERRFWRGLRNFFDLYSPLVNAWTLCDNSD